MTAEQTEEPTPEPEPTVEPSETPAPERLPDDHPAVKALAKANAEAEKYRLRVKEFEDANKSEDEKNAERLKSLEGDLSKAQADAVRWEIALDKGLTRTQARRLVGSTREELEADADELIADLGLDKQPESPSRRPKERLKPGSSPDTEPELSGAEIADRILSRNRI